MMDQTAAMAGIYHTSSNFAAIKQMAVTPKQEERFRLKIAQVKKTLTAEKRKFGWFDDSRGRRYLPPRFYIQLQDYEGGLGYLRWFQKNFPDDMGYPEFLLEWTIILFYCGKTEEAARMAFRSFCRNTYLFDKFFDKPIVPIAKWEGSNLETPAHAEQLSYQYNQPELLAFTTWLQALLQQPDFDQRCKKFVFIQQRLLTENDQATRSQLFNEARKLH